jgi:hydroxymethylglutaryl-CoA lyase
MKIILEEQGLRDGIQNLDKIVPTETKLAYINRLVAAGLTRIQVGSFVHPKFVPQMADTDTLCRLIVKKEGIIYDGLALNLKGVERGIDAGLTHLSMSVSASNTHSLKNVRMTIDEAKADIKNMVQLSHKSGVAVRGGIQCAFGCRFEGRINPESVLDLVKYLLDLGVEEIALADSTGMANPKSVKELMVQVVALAQDKPVALHLHNTENKGLANVYAAIEAGVRQFDTAFGGLGGCPFIKSATGNIATEDTTHLLHQMGYETGIDLAQIVSISQEMETFLGYKLPGAMYRLWSENVAIV